MARSAITLLQRSLLVRILDAPNTDFYHLEQFQEQHSEA